MVSNGMLDQVFNAFARILPQVREDPNSNLLCKSIHTVFGINAASIITALGDPGLFGRNPLPQGSGVKEINEKRRNSETGRIH